MAFKTSKIVNITLGALISLIVMGFIIGVVTFFWMLHLGYEPITTLSDYMWTFAFVLFLILLMSISLKLVKRKKPNFAKGILFGFAPIVFVLISNSIGMYQYLTPQKFDKTIWSENNPKSYEMSRSLIKNELTLGLTKHELIEMLGDDYVEGYSNDSTLIYGLDNARIVYLVIHLNQNGFVYRTNYIYYD